MNARVIEEISSQVNLQMAKWGEQNHLPYTWIAILTEEVGEVCHAALERDVDNYREELIHVIAVAVAQVECWDRNRTFNLRTGETHEL